MASFYARKQKIPAQTGSRLQQLRSVQIKYRARVIVVRWQWNRNLKGYLICT